MKGGFRRRVFLLSSAAWALLGVRFGAGEEFSQRREAYRLDVGVLHGLLTLTLSGTVHHEVDPAAGRYRLRMQGQGAGAVHRTESVGIVKDGRCFPTESRLYQTIRGRETTVSIAYDYARRLVEYQSVAHTLFLGRRRHVDDTLRLPEGQPVDDLASAYLNFGANKLASDGAGGYRTLIVRRAWRDNEGPDEVSSNGYRATLAPVRFHVAADPATGGLRGALDMTSLSSWARPSQPAKVSFDQHRHLQSFQASLILGTTITVTLTSGA